MKILKYQHWHFISLLALISVLYYFAKLDAAFLNGELYGISTSYWCVFALLSPIVHQVYVLICWRSELHYQSISNMFGENGFTVYKIGFALLMFSRLLTIVLLAISNANTLNINPVFAYILSALLLIPASYLFYSVKTYFGMDRAIGIDHFYPERFKNAPLVKQGIFKYTSNGMYVYGLLMLWIPGLLLLSKAALVLGIFNHVYIWVHYYVTELPDMKVIYGEGE